MAMIKLTEDERASLSREDSLAAFLTASTTF